MYRDLLTYLTDLGFNTGAIDNDLLLQTFTHKSFAADSPDEHIPYNERLEFLGDSLLWACVADFLYKAYPDVPESKLTLAKIGLVKEATLADVARKISLWQYIRLGNGEERTGGRDKDAILADALEAFIAYIYLDHGRENIASFINNHIMSELDALDDLPGKSWKSRLQELVQKRYQELPVYKDFESEVEETGNVLSYGTKVYINGSLVAEGIGQSKKKAQESAAEKAYGILQ